MELTEDRVRAIINEELDRREAGNVGAGQPVGTEPHPGGAGAPTQDLMAPRIDIELPRGYPGTTWIDSMGLTLPNANQQEGPAGYVQRCSRILARNDPSKQETLINSLGVVLMQSSAYGFTADRATWPEAAARFAAQMLATPGEGTVAGEEPAREPQQTQQPRPGGDGEVVPL